MEKLMNRLRLNTTIIVAWLGVVLGAISLLISLARLPLERQKMALEIEKLQIELKRLSVEAGQSDARIRGVEKTAEALKFQIRELLKSSRTDQPPTINGKLDEDAWSRTESLTYAVHPLINDSTTVTVKLLWDDQYLYAAFDVNDTQVEGSHATPQDGDSVSVIIDNGGQIREYRHSLLDDRAGNIESAYQLKWKTTFNNTKNVSDHDDGYTIEMRIPWAITPTVGNIIAADFLSVDHDQNPGGLFDDTKTIFSKISWDGDSNVRTANKKIQLLEK